MSERIDSEPEGLRGVYQDGADFYCDRGPVFSAPIKVRDHDMVAAGLARELFLAWCAFLQITVEWEP